MSDGEIVRGEGHAPGQGLGEAMPPVKTTERARASDFGRVIAERAERANQPNRAEPVKQAVAKPVDPAKQTASGRLGSFQDKLDAQQQAVAEGQEPAQVEPPAELAEGEQAVEGEKPEGEEQAAAAPDDQAALAKYREWEQSDLFPDEMLAKIHEIPVNGRIEYVDGNELRRGYQRGSDSRRMWGEAQQIQSRAQQAEQQQQQFFQAIQDPDQMIEILERNGYSPTLEKVVYKLAERIQGDRAIIRAAADAARARLGIQDYNHREIQDVITKTEARLKAAREAELKERRLTFREQQLQQQEQARTSQQSQEQWAAVYKRQLDQLRPNALRAYGIKDSAANHQAFSRHLQNVIAQQGFTGNITRDICMEAAKDLSEEQQDRIASEQGAGAAPGNGQALTPQQWAAQRRSKALPPTRLGGGAGKPMGGAAAKRGSLSDLEAMVAKGRMGG